jgi:hypothetical protein
MSGALKEVLSLIFFFYFNYPRYLDPRGLKTQIKNNAEIDTGPDGQLELLNQADTCR